MLYSSFVFFWMFWPQSTSNAAADFNWSVLMFMVVLIVAIIDWVFRGRKVYSGPVVLTEGYKGE